MLSHKLLGGALILLTSGIVGCGHTGESPMGLRIHTLDNGLTVYVSKNEEAPRVYTEIAVRAGSKHDPAETTGLAHYLEHLLFKGTDRIGTIDYAAEKVHLDRIDALYEERFSETDEAKRTALFKEIGEESAKAAAFAVPNEIDRFYSKIGGMHLNAHTSFEETVYKIGVPANRFEQWAKIESERFRKPVFRLFQPELEVVYEEKNRSLDDKFTLIHEAVNKRLFKIHPYGQQTTIGEAEHLKNPSLKNIYAYYGRHYVPGNMAIFISGDIDPDAAIATIEKHFGSWKAGPVPTPPPFKDPAPTAVERVEVTYPGEEFVLMGYRTASARSEDAEALKLLDMILDNSTAGLINLNLNQQQKVRRAGSFPMLLNDAGVQYLWGMPRPGQSLEAVEALLIAQIEQIQKGEFPDWLLEAIVLDYRKNHARKLEDNRARVSMMREAFLGFRDWADYSAEIERMTKVTKQDVMRVASEYFASGYVVGFRRDGQHHVPTIEKPRLDPVPIDPKRRSTFVKAITEENVPSLTPRWVVPDRDFQTTETGGVTVYSAKNRLNELFKLSIAVPIGSRHDKRLQLAERLLGKSGAGSRTAEETAQAWYRLGVDFRIEVSDNETRFVIEGLDDRLEESLALVQELIRTPNASDETLAGLVKILRSQRTDSRKDQKVVESALQLFSRYGDKSAYLARLSMTEIEKLTAAELTGAMSSLLKTRHRVSYTGPRDLAGVVSLLEKHHRPNEATTAAPAHVRLKMATPKATEIRFIHLPMAQALVRIEQVDGIYDPELFPEVELYNNYFAGGMNGIVFQELRESRALAYTAQARYMTGGRKGDENVMLGRIGTQADKTVDAVKAFLDLLDNMPQSESRFGPAKEAVVTAYQTTRVGFRRVLDRVQSWKKLGVSIDPRQRWYTKTQTLGLADVVAFHKSHLADKPKVISIVGDQTKIDLEKLKAIGPVTILTADDVIRL